MQGEYRGDFTRDTFRRANHFCRVLMQQGRVQLDADWNEQTSILLHYVRSLGRDLIGQHGGPGPIPGFGISLLDGVTDDFQIGAGSYYVDGIACELAPEAVPVVINGDSLEVDEPLLDGLPFQAGQYVEIFDPTGLNPPTVASIKGVDGTLITLPSEVGNIPSAMLRRVVTYRSQPDYPIPNTQAVPNPIAQATQCLVYLDVWERHLTHKQDACIGEVALGGADTASRAKLVWQVKVVPQLPPGFPANPSNLLADDQTWYGFVAANFQPNNRGLLKAQVLPQQVSTDACIISPASRFRGTENQLYRVEIHNGGVVTPPSEGMPVPADTARSTAPAGPAFKWSRENGSVIFPILKLKASGGLTTVTLGDLGRDSNLNLQVNDWVEVVDDNSTLLGSVDSLLQVQSIDPVNRVVTLAGASAILVDQPPSRHPILRRWDGVGPISESNSSLPANWITLEDGIQIQFQPAGSEQLAATYRSGDYWLIPARVATGTIEWPTQKNATDQIVLDPSTHRPIPDSLPPHGVLHHYAPLALVTVNAGAVSEPSVELRRSFSPLAQAM